MDNFGSVESELRDIEADFVSGRMNAFGSAATQDLFLRELKKIADVETQVFYKTCSILKYSTEEEHSMLKNMSASSQQSAKPTSSVNSTKTKPSTRGNTSPGSRSYNDIPSLRTQGSMMQSQGNTVQQSRTQTAEGNFSDKSFEDVAVHFRTLESDFSILGDHLKEISRHVMQLNDISEQVNKNPQLVNNTTFLGGKALVDPNRSDGLF